MKICRVCNRSLDPSLFTKDASYREGIGTICKDCTKAVNRRYYQKNKDHIAEYARKYRNDNREKERARDRKRDATPERRAHRRRMKIKHRDATLARSAVYGAIKRGDIERLPCEVCGDTKDIQAHHHKGYDKEHRLDVIFLCKKHHVIADKQHSTEMEERRNPTR